jgi:hypothetical protein
LRGQKALERREWVKKTLERRSSRRSLRNKPEGVKKRRCLRRVILSIIIDNWKRKKGKMVVSISTVGYHHLALFYF